MKKLQKARLYYYCRKNYFKTIRNKLQKRKNINELSNKQKKILIIRYLNDAFKEVKDYLRNSKSHYNKNHNENNILLFMNFYIYVIKNKEII